MDKLKKLLEKKNIYIEKKIGSGSFGDVFKAIDKKTSKSYAIKIENTDKISRLEYEVKLYKSMNKATGIPSIRWFGNVNDKKVLTW